MPESTQTVQQVQPPKSDSTGAAAQSTKDANTLLKGKKRNDAIGTQRYLRFAEIHDNVLILKNGGLRTVLRASSVNFNLKSEQEQNGIIYGYQNFLNSLEFPVQIVVQSRKLDIDRYLEKLDGIEKNQTNPLLRSQTVEYRDFIARLVEYADIMQKDFYVIVPYDPVRAKKISLVESFLSRIRPKDTYAELKKRHSEFDANKKALDQRVLTVQSGLSNVGINTTPLTTQELIELFYNVYNPVSARNQRVDDLSQVAILTDEQMNQAREV